MTKYLPSIIPIITLVVTALSTQVQQSLGGLEQHHPLAAMLVTVLSVIAAHWLPSPNTPPASK